MSQRFCTRLFSVTIAVMSENVIRPMKRKFDERSNMTEKSMNYAGALKSGLGGSKPSGVPSGSNDSKDRAYGNQGANHQRNPGQNNNSYHNKSNRGGHASHNQGHGRGKGRWNPDSHRSSPKNQTSRRQGYGRRGGFQYNYEETSLEYGKGGQTANQSSAASTAQRSCQLSNSERKNRATEKQKASNSAVMSQSRSDSEFSLQSYLAEINSESDMTSERSPPSNIAKRSSLPETPMKILSISDEPQSSKGGKDKSPKPSGPDGGADRSKRPSDSRTKNTNEPMDQSLRDVKSHFQNKEEEKAVWKGVPINQLRRAPECFKEYMSEDNQASDHELRSEDVISPARLPPPSFVLWPNLFSKSPKAYNDRYPDGLWILNQPINNPTELENAIRSICIPLHNPREVDFGALQQFFETMTLDAVHKFFIKTLPRMQKLALELPLLFQTPLPILKQRVNQEVTLTQHQAACLLANAFFCTFPKQFHTTKEGKPLKMPDFNFINLYSHMKSHRKVEKLKCILNYFERVTENMPQGTVTFRRIVSQPENWRTMEKKLTNVHVSTEGTIEDERGFLQVDFANKFVGGGVLNTGLVQEEIRFVLCPEMIVSRLITEELSNGEVLVMIGCERFNGYTGYSDTFKFAGSYFENTERDQLGRRYIEVVAMDASVFRNDYYEQFKMHHVIRELNKAHAAFKRVGASNLPAVCTGNWGCGAFGGDKQLKALIQIMAASAAERDICYLTFGESDLCYQIGHICEMLKTRNISIKDIMEILTDYSHSDTSDLLFKYMEDKLTGNTEPEKPKSSVAPKSQNSSSPHVQRKTPNKKSVM